MGHCAFCVDDPQSLRREQHEWVHVFPVGEGLEYTAPCTAPCDCNEDRDCYYCHLKRTVKGTEVEI